jgi:hypothetical protein
MGIDILKIHTKEHPFPRDLIVEQSILDFLERNHTANLVELITFIKSRSRAIVDALDVLIEEGLIRHIGDEYKFNGTSPESGHNGTILPQGCTGDTPNGEIA